MSPIEALAVLGLKPGRRYTEQKLNAVVTAHKIQAQNAYRSAATVHQQEAAIQMMQQISEAASALRACVKHGVLYVPRMRAPAARTRVARQSRAVGSVPIPASTTATTAGFDAWSMLKTAFRAVRDLLIVAWWLLTRPVKLLIERKVVRSAASFVLVAILIWLCWTLLTGSIQALSSRVQALCEAVNGFLTKAIK